MTRILLYPLSLCETQSGNLAHSVGRLAFRPGRPMLVEHVGGLFLEHDLGGAVLTPGYGPDYDIVHVYQDDTAPRRLHSQVQIAMISEKCFL